MSQRKLHLVCNSHIDPVWLWDWEEGLAETLATFRQAEAFCDEFPEFVFCHNESLLYQWIEKYEPDLHERIKERIRAGQWFIMGGWVVQPDCNIPSGEAMVRQALRGKGYFKRTFGVEPRVACNLDPFGHSRGLVQILAKSGYTGYLYCRPDEAKQHLPADDFIWVGYDGSKILAHRAGDHYNSQRGKAGEKIEMWLKKSSDKESGILLWGIGNHGGGPSREDLSDLRDLSDKEKDWQIEHSTPDAYFDELQERFESLHVHSGDLNPWGVGCYTSMARLKHLYRKMENTLFLTEKMAAHANQACGLKYPASALNSAQDGMLYTQFHDILPGSAIQDVEEAAVQKCHYALEILSDIRTQAFFALLSGQSKADEGDYPLFIYNPLPCQLIDTVVFEFQPPEPNFDPNIYWGVQVSDSEGKVHPSQIEKERSNIEDDQRKRVVFKPPLSAMAMNRFSVKIHPVPIAERKPLIQPERYCFTNEACEVEIDPQTGLLSRYVVQGIEFLLPDALLPMIMKDDADPWGMRVRSFPEQIGAFTLLSPEDAAKYAGVSSLLLEPIRLIEDGPIRAVVEVLMGYNHSRIRIRYHIPKKTSEIEVSMHVDWHEIDAMLKLSIPTPFSKGRCLGQVVYGVETFPMDGEEKVAQKWIAVASDDGESALTVINKTTYGFDVRNGELRISMLRGPAYAGHPVDGKNHIVLQDRHVTRIDQGQHEFRFWLNGGAAEDRLQCIEQEALVKNQGIPALTAYPSGNGELPDPAVQLTDSVIVLTAFKQSELGQGMVARLYNPTDTVRKTKLNSPILDRDVSISLNPFEIMTMLIDPQKKEIIEVDLLERSNNPNG